MLLAYTALFFNIFTFSLHFHSPHSSFFVCTFFPISLYVKTYNFVPLAYSPVDGPFLGVRGAGEPQNVPDNNKNYNSRENFFIGNKTSGRVFEICDVYETRRSLAPSIPSDLHFSSSSTSFVFFFITVIYCSTARKEVTQEWLKKKVFILTWQE